MDASGRILRPSERFANTGAFGDSGVFGQGGSLTPRSNNKNTNTNANATLSPTGTLSSSSSAGLTYGASSACSSRIASPTASKTALSPSEYPFLDFDPSATNKGYSLPAGAAAPARREGEWPLSLSTSSLSFDLPAPSVNRTPNIGKQSPTTPSKKKFFSFGRGSSKKDCSSSALSDDEGPPLSETPSKRFSRFSRSTSASDSSSTKKRSKSAGAAPRPSVTSQESADDWVVLHKRDDRASNGAQMLRETRQGANPIDGVRKPEQEQTSRAAIGTLPPVIFSKSTKEQLQHCPHEQVTQSLPTSPPFYPSSNSPAMSKTPPSRALPLHDPAMIPAVASASKSASRSPVNPFASNQPVFVKARQPSRDGKEDHAASIRKARYAALSNQALEPAFGIARPAIENPGVNAHAMKAFSGIETRRLPSLVIEKPLSSAVLPSFPHDVSPSLRRTAALTAANLASHLKSSSPVARPLGDVIVTCVGKPRFEEALIEHQQVLIGILDDIDYSTFRALSQTSSRLRVALSQSPLLDLMLERWLASFGYRPLASAKARKAGLQVSLLDLRAFYASTEYSLSEYVMLAMDHKRASLPMSTQRRLRAATRAHSKLVLRLRAQMQLPQTDLTVPYWALAGLQGGGDLFKPGRAVVLRIWVPAAGTWMTDAELVECEREIRRAGLWEHLQCGDLIRNVAISDIANEGVVIFDGRFFRDISYAHDPLGHLPSWLNGLAFSPSYFHNQLACTNGEPVVYLDLTSFLTAIHGNLALCKEKAAVTSPSGERYVVNCFMYRTFCEIVPGTMLGDTGGDGAAGLGGIEIVHDDWTGKLVIETEGTAEAARELIARVSANRQDGSANYPYKILRSLSKPGHVWISPVQVIVEKRAGSRSAQRA